MTLAFTIPWRVTSNNVASRRVGRRTIANPAAVADKQRIATIILAAMGRAWMHPEAAALYITAFNTRKDVGNVEKVISDACNGLVWRDDSIVTELHVEKRRDADGERYEVTIEPRVPLIAVRKKRARKAAK